MWRSEDGTITVRVIELDGSPTYAVTGLGAVRYTASSHELATWVDLSSLTEFFTSA
jgi:hypothetical protein